MNWHLNILGKGLLIVGVPLLAQLLFLGGLMMVRLDQAEAQKWAIHTKDVIARAETSHRYALDAVNQVRAYLITGDETYLDEFGKARAHSRQSLETLAQLVADNPPQQESVARITDQTDRLMLWLGEIAELLRAGNRQEAERRLKSPEARRRTQQLRGLTETFLQAEEGLDAERRLRLERATRLQNWALWGGVVLALASTGALVGTFSRGISGRLNVLMRNVRGFGEGKELTPPLPGNDEISQLDHAFHAMADALAQKDRENEMFVYSVSHDLRTPLVNLQGFSQELALVCKDLRDLVKEHCSPEQARAKALRLLDRDAAESIKFIQTAVTRLAGIIDALLRLSRVGRVEHNRQTVDLRAAVGRVVGSLSDSVTRRGATVTVGDLPPAWADPTAVDQIFANLLLNAVNYLDPRRPGMIEVGSLPPGDGRPPGMQVYYVKDNGLGIPPEYHDKIFLAFHRLHPDAAPGEGIGLALVRRAAERHGGKIWLESAPGVGSTFFVALPADAPRDACAGRGGQASPPMGRRSGERRFAETLSPDASTKRR